MFTNKIRHILCAVLGKPTSRTTVTEAIDLAIEHNARLTFAHVISADFLASATPTMTPLRAVYNQLRELGEFSMLILCDRATRRGVENADYIIREGQILTQLRMVINELKPDLFVVGKPVGAGAATQSIPPDQIEGFITDVEQNLGITVFPVEISTT